MTTSIQTPMETLGSGEAKDEFGRLLGTAQRESVTITKNDSSKETEYLLSTPTNRERLLASIKELEQGEVTEDELCSYGG